MGDFFIDINPKNRETVQFEHTLLYKKLELDEDKSLKNIDISILETLLQKRTAI